MIPTVIASAQLAASYAGVAPTTGNLPTPSVSFTVAPITQSPTQTHAQPAKPSGQVSAQVAGLSQGLIATTTPPSVTPTVTPIVAPTPTQAVAPTPNNPNQVAPPPKPAEAKWKIVEAGFMDAGYEKLLGTFSDVILRGGVRYGQTDFTAYFRNDTLNTKGTDLQYPQEVTGTSVGLELREWFPGNKMYATFSMGQGVGGYNEGKTDTRYGLVGYADWKNGRWVSDVYGELFYIALAGDTFLDARFRSGVSLYKDAHGSYFWVYAVGQVWASGQPTTGTENRLEAGPGIAYIYKPWNLSINIEAREGYSYRGPIPSPLYFNPTLIISTGFDKLIPIK